MSRWLVVHFHAGGKILSVWSENMGSTTESHLLCQLFFRAVIFPWEHLSAMQISLGSVRAVSYLDMKDGRMEKRHVKWWRGDEAPWGIVMPEIHWAPSWTEVIITSWPSIVLVLIAFKEAVMRWLSCLFSVRHIVYVCAPVCCCILSVRWPVFFFSFMVRTYPLAV